MVTLDLSISELSKCFTSEAARNLLKETHDYKNYDGILLPSSMPVESNLLEEGFLHEMRILDFSKNNFPERELRPNRALEPMGDEKL